MIQFTLYASSTTGNLSNCIYPRKVIVTDEASMLDAIQNDHVSAKYKNHYRSSVNFIKADNAVLDCDNDHSDNEDDWVDVEDVANTFQDVPFIAAYSRNHMKQKGSKSPRPRFHIYFMTHEITDGAGYAQLKQRIAAVFPYFDTNALDSARFIFGTNSPTIEIYDGSTAIEDFLANASFEDWDSSTEEIQEGSRNSTLSRYAGRVIVRLGNTDEAHALFLKEADKCNPPLEEDELDLIWNSAVNFGNRVFAQDDYIPPEDYASEILLKPDDFSDVGQAIVLSNEYKEVLRYSPATDFLVYNGGFWEESKPKAQAVAQDLTARQLHEAELAINQALNEMSDNGALDIVMEKGTKKAAQFLNSDQSESFEKYEDAMTYKKYVIQRRDSRKITASLKEASPMLEILPKDLDVDGFLLNTPDATFDLREGIDSRMEPSPLHLITKQTAVTPNHEGMDKWLKALDVFFCHDKELIEYVQRIVGLSAIGVVYVEALIIAYGEGRNGKSTFWNTIARVLGSYSGSISADILTVGYRRNVKPELAEAKGKRLLIAAELEEGMRLNTSNIKQLCSTDEITAEKKYKDPFKYVPSHTLVLYTNHLPKVGALDEGTWRRLIVIPFEAKITGNSDIKNYTDYLIHHAGGAILTWIIEGAKKIIDDDYKVKPPKKVQDAINVYKENNNWLQHFLDECCEIDENYTEKSGEVYDEYRAFCFRMGEFTRSTTDFYTALDSREFERKRTNKGVIIKGLKLKSEFA
ncbi:P4 family prophage LambdaSa04 [Sporosarcina newyorkensis 2681]|uniref:p4 family prophage LambdaSa04 n=1 Tax=Sporosarcina newyorkensis 2681 TaxID=1027292 RepID=F9DR46_9BACL|nr:phage/plasmid primase, P4 family [Sporosarcina newyorkensis]EGQ26735.1 P4 family prophage LambdaSa04 [Sporosarcina newyorkensis 2681]